MDRNANPKEDPTFAAAEARWADEYGAQVPDDDRRLNRSGIEIKPIYTPADSSSDSYLESLGFPGQLPATRGIYPLLSGLIWVVI